MDAVGSFPLSPGWRWGSGWGRGVWAGGLICPIPACPQLAVNIGNTRFNEIMEATLPSQDCPKPSASSDM